MVQYATTNAFHLSPAFWVISIYPYSKVSTPRKPFHETLFSPLTPLYLTTRRSPTLQVWARRPSWSRLPSFRHFPLLHRYRSQRGRQRSARARVRIRLWSRSPWRHRRYRYRCRWPRSCCHRQHSATTLVSSRNSRLCALLTSCINFEARSVILNSSFRAMLVCVAIFFMTDWSANSRIDESRNS